MKTLAPVVCLSLALWASLAQAADTTAPPSAADANPVVAKIGKETLRLDAVNAFYDKAKGSFGKPVKSEFGWHVIKVEERRKANPPALDAVKGKVQAQLRQEKVKEAIAAIKAKMAIQTCAADGAPLEAKK